MALHFCRASPRSDVGEPVDSLDIVAKRETAAIRSDAGVPVSFRIIVAKRETAAIRSASACGRHGPVDCSKTRDGRNPQLAHGITLTAADCSKTRDGRNPQLAHGITLTAADCSKKRDGRNPQPKPHKLE